MKKKKIFKEVLKLDYFYHIPGKIGASNLTY